MGVDLKLKRAQSLVGTSADKNKPIGEYYATPSEAIYALLSVEKFEGGILEPCCGSGHISKVLEAEGHIVISSDLIDRGYGIVEHDFFTSPFTAENLITNPPFSLAEKIIPLALERTTKKVAMLGKIQFLEGIKRKSLFESTPLKACYVFSKRIKMARNNELEKYSSSMMCFAWYVWEHGYTGDPKLGWV